MDIGSRFEEFGRSILRGLGYSDITKGDRQAPFDFKAKRGHKTFFIEVRGRTPGTRFSDLFFLRRAKLEALKLLGEEKVRLLLIRGKEWRMIPLSEIRKLPFTLRGFKLYGAKFDKPLQRNSIIPKNRSITVRLCEEDHGYLESLVDESGKTKSEIIRGIIEKYRERGKGSLLSKREHRILRGFMLMLSLHERGVVPGGRTRKQELNN